MTYILPKIPSQLIRIGLEDLRKCEADPRYDINMSWWHKSFNDKCVVCFAGSVMANHLSADLDHDWRPDDFPENQNQLEALNMFRHAHLMAHLMDCMILGCEYLDATPIDWEREIPKYADDPEGFHAAMNALADAFEESGQ